MRRRLRAPGALARYVLSWLAGGAVVAVVLVALLREDAVTLPPVHETELTSAAARAGCDLRRAAPMEVTRPPVDGAAGTVAAAPGIYDTPLEPARLGAAVRRGIVVIHHRPDVPADVRDQLETIQKALPEGTIVTPDRSGMPYELAVTSYRRLLGCRQVRGTWIDALRLFRGRFIGTGPDR